MSEDEGRTAIEDFGGLIDWPRVNAWLATHDAPGSGPVTSVRKLKGGIQNNVFLVERGGESFVLRRPSKHLRPNSNETMLREARVLKALAGTDVPHPRFYSVCEDASVIGACFYLMEPLEGFAPSGQLPGQYATDIAWRRAMGEELVKAAAALAAVDPKAVGLDGLGKPDDWHERQVSRWRSQLDGYRTMPNYGEHALPHIDEVGQWLSDNLPRDRRIGITHGDLQFANVMFSLRAPRISGVVDWELTTLGDPVLDLGWVLGSWWEKGDPEGKQPLVAPWEGFLSRAELVQLYGGITGRDMGDLPWFFALACYKLACLLEGTYARSKAGQIPAEIGQKVHAYAVWLMAKSTQVIAG
ncbi:MAG: phosphotransferase family protein [Gammaproteobacteria bacterium]|nr:phosphotransferase family protein [Gammaproteobacteria bacterium]